MDRISNRIGRYFVGYMLTISLLCGCGMKEVSKTIVLPEENREEAENGSIEIKDIHEYTYEGNGNELGYIAWDQEDEDSLWIVRDAGADTGMHAYYAQKIDMDTKEILENILLDEREISNGQIAPGGKYISFETWEESMIGLVIFKTSEQEATVLREWEDATEMPCYAWSGDGTKFFSWTDGNYCKQNPYQDWSICRYDMETGEKIEIQFEGNEYFWRTVVPNRDGSKVYITENGMEQSRNTLDMVMEENSAEDGTARTVALHRILDMNTQEICNLGDQLTEMAFPMFDTEAGLIAKDRDDHIVLYQDLTTSPAKKDLLTLDYMNAEVFACEQGDHIFLVEGDQDNRYMQVVGMQIEDGEVTGQQVLYKGIAGNDATVAIHPMDHAVAIQSSDYIENDRWRITITVLEY